MLDLYKRLKYSKSIAHCPNRLGKACSPLNFQILSNSSSQKWRIFALCLCQLCFSKINNLSGANENESLYTLQAGHTLVYWKWPTGFARDRGKANAASSVYFDKDSHILSSFSYPFKDEDVSILLRMRRRFSRSYKNHYCIVCVDKSPFMVLHGCYHCLWGTIFASFVFSAALLHQGNGCQCLHGTLHWYHDCLYRSDCMFCYQDVLENICDG